MERKMLATLAVTFLLFAFFNFAFLNFTGVPFSIVAITGYAINDTAIVQILIEEFINLYILSPENITYDFNRGEPLLLDLNVSTDFVVNPTTWSYSLFDLEHDVFIEQDTPFSPNASISVVRWGNLLTVSVMSDGGQPVSSQVVFFVNISNSAPLLGNISDPIFVCEGERLEHRINATDIDEEDLIGDISPRNPFYLTPEGRVGNMSFFDIVSGVLRKVDVGNYTESVSVIDSWDFVDIRNVSIEVIEVNNLPVFDNIGAQTVWLAGDDSNFYYVVDTVDVEDGVNDDGNFSFNLTWGSNENLFDVGATDGVMNYTPIIGQEGRVYSLEICVRDSALEVAHQNISLCSPVNASSNMVCDNFTLTVTDENRAPEILNYTPVNDTFVVLGTASVEYFSEVYDADGTIPDIDWYVDGTIQEHNENISNDSFVFSFGCEVSGAHSISIFTTDGLLNDSQTWYVSVGEVACPIPSSGGGGGGGSREFCLEDWVCDDWMVCQNVKKSFDSGMLSVEDYSVMKNACFQNKEEDERYCGFQITTCHDLNICGRDDPVNIRPLERQFCYFGENPSCFDKVTNCHDGACELLVDCGGPCGPCATCSDGKQNQGEEDVDCGGPCPFQCEPETPFAMLSSILIVIAIVLVIIIFWAVWKLFLLWKNRDKDF